MTFGSVPEFGMDRTAQKSLQSQRLVGQESGKDATEDEDEVGYGELMMMMGGEERDEE